MNLRNTSKCASIIAVGIASTQAYARGDERGNGGSGIVCHAAGATSVQITETMEATRRGWTVELGDASLTPAAKVDLATARLASLDPMRAARFNERAHFFLEHGSFQDGIHLPSVGDGDVIAVPTGCELVQIAIRREPILPQDPLFVIDNSLYTALDNENKAILALHEAIYEEAFVDFEQPNSMRARIFNAEIFSAQIDHFDRTAYIDFLHTVVQFPSVSFGAYKFIVNENFPNFHADTGDVEGFISAPNLDFRDQVDGIAIHMDADGEHSYVRISAAGALLCLSASDFQIVSRGNHLVSRADTFDDNLVCFYPQGGVHFAWLVPPSVVKKRDGTTYSPPNTNDPRCIEFDEDGYFSRDLGGGIFGPRPPCKQ